ncbi:hypothetical protein M0R45_034439 [Rubus argutus]|uniref:Uncharacterized protein n=1 Tax=Rubus argutus TaxID=59490 RepID=A0AAW1VVK4_RUBAR
MGMAPENLFPVRSSAIDIVQLCKEGATSPERWLLRNLNHSSCGSWEHRALGISPDRLLWDRSRIISCWQPVQSEGIFPDKLFLERSRIKRYLLVKEGGIVPFRLFLERSRKDARPMFEGIGPENLLPANSFKCDRFPIDIGSGPEILLLLRYKLCKCERLPIDVGNGPEIELSLRFKICKRERFPIDMGSGPWIELWLRSNVSKFERLPIDVGSGPEIELP